MPGIDDDDPVLRPRDLYEQLGRSDEYAKIVDTLKRERTEYLQEYPALSEEIINAAA